MKIPVPPARVPVKVTNFLGMKAFRPLNETAHLEAAIRRVRYFPQRTMWKTRHRIEHIQGVAWRIKNIDIPYWQKTRLK